MVRKSFVGLMLASLVSIVASDAEAADITTIATLDPAQGQLPEAITVDDDGNVYLSMFGNIVRSTPQGQLSTFATIPIPPGTFSLGMKFGPGGYLYVAGAGFSPDPAAAQIWRVSPDGQDVETFATLDPNGFPNDLAFDDDDNLFVTDPWLGLVYKIDPAGNPSVWLSDPLLAGNTVAPVFGFHAFGVDGIAFDKKKENLYFGNLDFGEILRVPLDANGAPGDVEVVASDARLIGADGIAFDKKGDLYVAVNAQNQLAVVDGDGDVSLIAQGAPLDGPSSLAFGPNGDDKKDLYISSFAIGAALGGGTPHPALHKTTVQHGGLPLP